MNDLTRIRRGNWFNEESIFFNKPSRYDIRVVSDVVNIIKLSKDQVYSVFNDEVRTEFKIKYKEKL